MKLSLNDSERLTLLEALAKARQDSLDSNVFGLIGKLEALATAPAESNAPAGRDYSCHGPFVYGYAGNPTCVHGWNCGHTLTGEQASEYDRLFNCGLLPARQQIEKIER